jgi:enoyl-CoA hydratase
MSGAHSYDTILVDRPRRGVGRITLHRPKSLNALSSELQREFLVASLEFDADPLIGAIVVTGSERAFAAGADIVEMSALSYADVEAADLFAGWDAVAGLRTPLIAAVSGHALGGGAELVMLCDVVVASTTARFGQPEIKLGILPGIGGTQRLTRAIGKAKAMDLCLTGRTMDVDEAERAGLVSRVVSPDRLEDEALAVAAAVAAMSRSAVVAAKAAVNRSFETTLAEGIRYERLAFTARFASEDRTEGMAAFQEKRPPRYHQRQQDEGSNAGG